jgi:hypothetical protein
MHMRKSFCIASERMYKNGSPPPSHAFAPAVAVTRSEKDVASWAHLVRAIREARFVLRLQICWSFIL